MPMLSIGAKCLAFHGPLLYEAKILRVYDPETKVIKLKGPGNEETETGILDDIPADMATDVAYYVHYKGWKSTWDEWIREDRVLLWNEENLRTQKELRQAAFAKAAAKESHKKKHNERDSKDDSPRFQKRSRTSASTGGESGSSTGPSSGSGGGQNGSANSVLEELEREEEYAKRYEISLAVPETLKALLVDDWEMITKNHKLVSLPCKLTVVDILKQYKESVLSKLGKSGYLSAEEDIFDEVISGIKLYFDKALGNILLYRFERQQYLEIRKKYGDEPSSKIYGAEHLLRLFVTLPGLIAQTNMDTQSVNVLREHLESFLKYMARHQKEIFLKNYEDVTSKYEAFSRGL